MSDGATPNGALKTEPLPSHAEIAHQRVRDFQQIQKSLGNGLNETIQTLYGSMTRIIEQADAAESMLASAPDPKGRALDIIKKLAEIARHAQNRQIPALTIEASGMLHLITRTAHSASKAECLAVQALETVGHFSQAIDGLATLVREHEATLHPAKPNDPQTEPEPETQAQTETEAEPQHAPIASENA